MEAFLTKGTVVLGMTLEQAIAYALSDEQTSPSTLPVAPSAAPVLQRRAGRRPRRPNPLN